VIDPPVDSLLVTCCRHPTEPFEKTTVSYFVTNVIKDTQPRVTAESFENEISETPWAGTVFYKDRFTIANFEQEARRSPHVLVFLGHALTRDDDPGRASALRFGDGGTTESFQSYLVLKMDPQFHPGFGFQSAVRERVPTHSRVLYMGSCNVGDHMKTLFGFDEVPESRAMIWLRSANPSVGLNHARVAWLLLAEKLLSPSGPHDPRGMTVADAVQQVNAVLPSPPYGITDELAYIGDPSTRIR
jgi:hypothetical protein